MRQIYQGFCLYISILIPLCNNESYAQTSISASYPELKHTYFLNLTHSIGRLEEKQKASVNVLYQNYLNLLREIRLTDFSGYYRVGKIHQVGLQASSFHEGEYIGKTSVAGHYAVNVKVMKQSVISSAVSGGFKSITLDGTLTNLGQNTSFVPDVSLNIAIRNPRYFVFVASNQLIGSKIKPGLQTFKLKRFYETRIGFQFPIARRMQFITQAHALLYDKGRLSIGGCAGIEAYSVIKVAVGTYDLNSILFQVAIGVPDAGGWELSFLGSYRQLIGVPASLLSNSMEISLLVSKKVKKDVYVPEE